MLTRRILPAGPLLGMALIIASCAAPSAGPGSLGAAGSDAHIPPFARALPAVFARGGDPDCAARMARLWSAGRLSRTAELPFDNERAEGLWQRVGDYWWLGLRLGDRDQGCTGMHDQNGANLPGRRGRQFRLVGGFYRLRHADGGGRAPLSLFVDPFRLHQRRPPAADRRRR